MPRAEALLWAKLRRKQILGYRFRRQYSVERYVIDFFCPALKLAIEVDGDSHFQKGSQHKDRSRQTFLESFGIHFFRIRNVEVFEHLDDIVLAIGRRIQDLERTKFTPL
jgi:very-short-patch-repair endonuclease